MRNIVASRVRPIFPTIGNRRAPPVLPVDGYAPQRVSKFMKRGWHAKNVGCPDCPCPASRHLRRRRVPERGSQHSVVDPDHRTRPVGTRVLLPRLQRRPLVSLVAPPLDKVDTGARRKPGARRVSTSW